MAEMSKFIPDDITRGVAEDIITVNQLFHALPFVKYNGDGVITNRENVLGDVENVHAYDSEKIKVIKSRWVNTTDIVNAIAERATGAPRVQPPDIQVFTSNGTFVVPAGVTRLHVQVQGGGGGGGFFSGTSYYSRGAGGGGYSEKSINVTPGQSIPVTVGSGGAKYNAGSGGYKYAPAGATSSFGSFCSATGGMGGGNAHSSPTFALGGVGSGGDLNIQGETGTAGPRTGGNMSGGSSALGGQYGSGGHTANNYSAATAGGDGIVIVRY